MRIVTDACGLFPALVPYPLVLPSKPGFNYEGTEGNKGGDEDFSTCPAVPAGRYAGQRDQQAEQDEECAVNGSGEMNSLIVALHPLEKNGAVEQHEERGSLQEPHEA